jgi:hypothetical protein
MVHKESPGRTATRERFSRVFAWALWVSFAVEAAWACAGAGEANTSAAHSAITTSTA